MPRKTDAAKLREMGEQRALIAFHKPEGMTTEAIGLILGDALDSRENVLRAAAAALEDMNFHNDAATLREMAGDAPYDRVPDHIEVDALVGVSDDEDRDRRRGLYGPEYPGEKF